jgi:hypothetical protein
MNRKHKKTFFSSAQELLLLALGVFVFLAAPDAMAARKALFVGIAAYPNVAPLDGPQNDVANMKKFAHSYWGYQENETKVLIDKEATKKNILKTMEEWLVLGTRPGDEVLFYYSGHGYQVRDTSGDEEDKFDETLVSYDSRPVPGTYTNMITDDEFNTVLDRIADRKVTVIIDSCHSGTITRALLPDTGNGQESTYVKSPGLPMVQGMTRSISKDLVQAHRYEESFIKGSGTRIVWTAVSAAQKALIDMESATPSSVFTNRLIEGLDGGKADANKDGEVSNGELLDYLREESDAFCKRNKKHCPLGLTPTFEAAKDLYVESAGPRVLVQPRTEDTAAAKPRTETASGQAAMVVTSAEPASQGHPPAIVVRPRPGSEDVVGSAPIKPQIQPESRQEREPKANNQTVQLAQAALAHSNQAGLSLELVPGGKLKIGEKLRFKVTSERNGYLIVFDVDPTGKLTQLFPNKYSDKAGKSNYVTAGRSVTIPDPYYGFEMSAREPVGKGSVFAIVSEDNVPVAGLLNKHKDLEVVPRPEEYLTELAAKLREVWHSDSLNRQSRWSMTEHGYMIVN